MRIWLSPAGQARHVWSIVSYYDWARAQMERNVNLEDWNAATSQTQVWDGGRMKNTVIGISNCWLNFSKAKWMNGCCPGSSLYIFTLAKCSWGWHMQRLSTLQDHIVDPCWDYSGTIVRVWFCVLCRGLLAGADCLCFAPRLGKLKITSQNLAALCPACIISSLRPDAQPRTIRPSSKSAHTPAEQRSRCKKSVKHTPFYFTDILP